MIINYDLDKNISSIIHKNLYFIKKYPVNVCSLNSLRERDWEALTSLFDRDDSDEIEDEIKRMFEKWYSVIFITLLPPLVPPCKGGKQ
jgi:hypothetical protein